ncbi:uncharacterized protein [Lolium perenne]|uniref:uncharacterized protein isoform X2 n=1 Tax=Lolium perenne TaxID=4522 RepID=UPI0021F557E7|nr:uncharacterized protein LOC127302901 isoform X2 [Lolium perenne]
MLWRPARTPSRTRTTSRTPSRMPASRRRRTSPQQWTPQQWTGRLDLATGKPASPAPSSVGVLPHLCSLHRARASPQLTHTTAAGVLHAGHLHLRLSARTPSTSCSPSSTARFPHPDLLLDLVQPVSYRTNLFCPDVLLQELKVLEGYDHTRLLPLHDWWVEEQEVEAELLFANLNPGVVLDVAVLVVDCYLCLKIWNVE